MIDHKYLDAALRHLLISEDWNKSCSDLPQFDKEQNDSLFAAYRKMEKDGFTYSVYTKITTFYISLDGIIALQESGGMPYQEKAKKERLLKYWNVAKIVAVAINAAVVLFYTIMSFYKN
ncbi:hypothetical protein NZ698_00410 [Chryseobacterium sp. PBS4-4]|uniref:Uncharacterized protein n=1 Tax=Chryseobacterium edaphi TaxID=2976532 RepID=A0ABT2W067_9FLAO|nr:hypothetical protein [Chryseobacterium edaphi]MCU7615642.1 hypothetical protein [Chryseobacterium edaphi]